MAVIHQQIQHNSGIPLGGIGTGSVEIRPDGLFHDWEIFNCGPWSPHSPGCLKDCAAMNSDDLIFMVRTHTANGKTIVRYLALREDLHDLYSLPWARSVQAIGFEGTFPVATLTYEDPQLPVFIRAEVFSPFIPLDSQTSGTPGFHVHFTAKNPTSAPVHVSILGIMKNAAGYDQPSREPRNKLEGIGSAKAVVLSADRLANGHPSTGDMTLAALGGDISYITGSFERDHKTTVFWRPGRFRAKTLSFLHQFRDQGALPNLAAETQPQMPTDFKAAGLSAADRRKLLAEMLQHPFVYDKYHRIAAADPDLPNSPEFLDDLVGDLSELAEKEVEWGWAALCSNIQLAPEEEAAALFTVAWYFPNHISPTGENIGHKYEHWFESSVDVARFLVENYPDLRADTFALPEAIHGSSMPSEAADAVTGQLSTLTKCTWWTKAGHFGVWEGLGCCGFHTTDITYQGSFPIISLFPDLQKIQMEHGARFQREDGRVHHFFTPDFTKVDEGFDRVDMNPQFVMLAARDYLWTGDKGYLQRLWPHIIRAMDNTAQLDTDGDGLPDADTRRNTYDNWDFAGCPSYISSLWLGALKAAVRLARDTGDAERAARWQSIYDRGVASFEGKLWNGDYYVLCRDGDEIDECCMSDQMSGDWFASVCGWGPILQPRRIRRALGNIVRYNFCEGEGLINASYPPGKKHRLAASGNFQADAPWTGIEYTVASLLIHHGLLADGLAVVRDIHNRYLQAGRFWNHVECGDHYYRAMSSWTVLLALSGFCWDRPAGALTFAPAMDEQTCEYPFFTPCAWGSYYQESGLGGKIVEIQLAAGEMTLTSLSLPRLRDFAGAAVFLGESKVACKVRSCGEGMRATFDPPVVVTPEKPLAITNPL